MTSHLSCSRGDVAGTDDAKRSIGWCQQAEKLMVTNRNATQLPANHIRMVDTEIKRVGYRAASLLRIALLAALPPRPEVVKPTREVERARIKAKQAEKAARRAEQKALYKKLQAAARGVRARRYIRKNVTPLPPPDWSLGPGWQ